jgi:lipopolysaccharide transport system ATP-binding protein
LSDFAVRLEGISKKYKMFTRRRDHLLDTFGINRLLPWVKAPYRDFWALRGIDLELQKGQRIGIIGRNGAGKTTLLKLITGNITPTKGKVEVGGQVHALLDVAGGFHPEFTGRQNIRYALTYQGINSRDIKVAEDDIAEFTDLGDFLDQPFKTYSLGMKARLTFACATAVTPDILIVDEVLGVGDAAFYRRSTDRMRDLMHDGASVLLVSHALQQVQRFCDESIWLEHGEIVMRGATTEVVKSYEKFTRELDETWLLKHRDDWAAPAEGAASGSVASTTVSEWKDLPGLRIKSVALEDGGGKERAIFNVREAFRVRVRVSADVDGRFPVTPVAQIFRPDGLIVTRHLGGLETVSMQRGAEFEALLDLGPLQLGNGEYFLSIGIWADVDPEHIEPSTYYHHLDRSFRFSVVGNPPMHDELFNHPGTWRIHSPGKQGLTIQSGEATA